MKAQSYFFKDDEGRRRAILMLSGLPLNGRNWKITWQEASEKRRDAQNRLLWLWNGCIQTHMRECFGIVADSEEWHEILCRRLMPMEARTVRLPDGMAYEAGRWRSSKASVKEMAQYLNLLDAYCAEHLQLLLPHPEDIFHEAMMRRSA